MHVGVAAVMYSVAAALQVLLLEVGDNRIKNEPCDCPHKSSQI